MPLYDILNEFQKGSSHMAALVKARGKSKAPPPTIEGEKDEGNKISGVDSLTTPLLSKQDGQSDHVVIDVPKIPKPTNIKKEALSHYNVGDTNGPHMSEDIEDGEVIGFITLEDLFEELLQEEIIDETDEYVDVHKRMHVAAAAAAAASSVARASSMRKLNVNKGTTEHTKLSISSGAQAKQLTPKKSTDEFADGNKR